MDILEAAIVVASSLLSGAVVFLVHRKVVRRYGEKWSQPYKASR